MVAATVLFGLLFAAVDETAAVGEDGLFEPPMESQAAAENATNATTTLRPMLRQLPDRVFRARIMRMLLV
jgi:hypothetical protein